MRITQLTEDIAKDVAVFYGGRFSQCIKVITKCIWIQWNSLVPNVFIATTVRARLQHQERDPFSFEEKRMIMNDMFNIPMNNIVQTQPIDQM